MLFCVQHRPFSLLLLESLSGRNFVLPVILVLFEKAVKPAQTTLSLRIFTGGAETFCVKIPMFTGRTVNPQLVFWQFSLFSSSKENHPIAGICDMKSVQEYEIKPVQSKRFLWHIWKKLKMQKQGAWSNSWKSWPLDTKSAWVPVQKSVWKRYTTKCQL